MRQNNLKRDFNIFFLIVFIKWTNHFIFNLKPATLAIPLTHQSWLGHVAWTLSPIIPKMLVLTCENP